MSNHSTIVQQYSKTLTIVIPTYNMEAFLKECLDSVVLEDENLRNEVEVIVVNDGSNDSSLDIMHQYAKAYPNYFHIIDKPNGGHGSCCNVGIDNASGKYIHFLDSDDFFDHNGFPAYIKELKRTDTDIVISKHIIYDETTQTSVIHKFNQLTYNKIYDLEKTDILSKKGFGFTIHETSYKTQCLRKSNLRFLEHVSYDDNILTFGAIENINSIYLLDICLYHYRIGRQGQSSSQEVYKRHFNDLVKNVDYLIDTFNKNLNAYTHNKKTFVSKKLARKIQDLVYKYVLFLPYEDAKEMRSLLKEKYKSIEVFYKYKLSLKLLVYKYSPIWFSYNIRNYIKKTIKHK